MTILHYACQNSRRLLDVIAKCDRNIIRKLVHEQDFARRTPLHYAGASTLPEQEKIGIICYLMNRGADPKHVDLEGNVPDLSLYYERPTTYPFA